MITVTLRDFKAKGSQQAYAEAAINWLESTLNKPAFAQAVQNASYTATDFLMDTGERVPVTNDILWQCIAGGREWGQPFDAEIDIWARLVPMEDHVLGGVTPPSNYIETNPTFFNKWMNDNNMLILAAHWFHEWLHTAGVYHQDGPASFTDAAYVLGNLVLELGGPAEEAFNKSRTAVASTAAYAAVYRNPAIRHGPASER